MNTQAIPVTVLTGFLGAGKTTLLNRILTEQHGRKIAVIENEFGEVGVDHQLVIQADEEMFEMNNGCICCTVRGDLIRILTRLAQRTEKLDCVLIETTGLANPGPVALTFFTDPEVKTAFRLDGIVTLVDAKHLSLHIDESDEARQQVAFADVIVINKTDLVAPDELPKLETRIQKLNPRAVIHRTQNAAVAVDEVLSLGAFNVERALEVDPKFLEPEYPFEWGGCFNLPAGEAQFVFGEGPDPEMDLALIPVTEASESNLKKATDQAVLSFSDENPATVQPGQGLTPSNELRRIEFPRFPAQFPVVIAKPGHYMFFTQHHPDEFGATLQVNGQKGEPIWSHAFKPDHEHDEEVGSVGLTFAGELDAERLNSWLTELLRTKGPDIFRSKGVLAIKDNPQRLVFQGVHMLFDARYDRPWGTEPRANTFVFIGRNLDRAALTAGFKRCLVS